MLLISFPFWIRPGIYHNDIVSSSSETIPYSFDYSVRSDISQNFLLLEIPWEIEMVFNLDYCWFDHEMFPRVFL